MRISKVNAGEAGMKSAEERWEYWKEQWYWSSIAFLFTVTPLVAISVYSGRYIWGTLIWAIPIILTFVKKKVTDKKDEIYKKKKEKLDRS